MNTKVTKRLMLFMFMAMVSVAVLIPVYAHAYDAPGTDYPTDTIETADPGTASTAINLKHIKGKIDFMAPTAINLTINEDGTFNVPTAETTYIQNKSIIDLYVLNVTVENTAGTGELVTNGQAKWDSGAVPKTQNAFWVQMMPSNGSETKPATPYELGAAGETALYTTSTTCWKLEQQSTEKEGGKVLMTLSGQLINLTDGLHTELDKTDGYKLQTYTWKLSSHTT